MMPHKRARFDYIGYEEYLYTGIHGAVMRQNHRILSRRVCSSRNRKILEVGGGGMPHYSLISLKGVSEYWVSDVSERIDRLLHQSVLPCFELKTHRIDRDPHYAALAQDGHQFSRIIVSHVWEHIPSPEDYFLEWMNLLEPGGQLDIAIPCDPGWLWRIGQLAGRRKAKKKYNMSSDAIDLVMAREHVNSCQNLLRIARYYSYPDALFYPFLLPIVNFNIFVFLRIRKSVSSP